MFRKTCRFCASIRAVSLALTLLMGAGLSAVADGRPDRQGSVRALFDLGALTTGPFPSDWFSVLDRSHNTGRRVNVPLPDCTARRSDCLDLAVINELDGFNLQPRLSVPFSGPINVDSVTSNTVFLLSLGSTLPGQGYMPRGTVVGVNQVVWDVETNTLHVESDELLAQHTRFALIVTNGVRDAAGDSVEASREFRRFRQTAPREYRRELLDAIHEARRLGVRERDMVTASVFTTQSATAVLEKIRDQIHAATPEPAEFLLGPGRTRTVFDLNQVKGITYNRQTRTDMPLSPVPINLNLLRIIPGAVGTIAYGKYLSPDYEVHPGEYIPPVGTSTGAPRVQGVNEMYFTLVLPSGPRPANGWPVAIIGHGSSRNKDENLSVFTATLAAEGIATIAINAVGSGYGLLSTLTVSQSGGESVTFSEGGRGVDQNGDHVIGVQEGLNATSPRTIIGPRDGQRQTVADLMQLVRTIEVGMDLDGDGSADLDASRISYFGSSFGGYYGTQFLAVEPDVQTGVLTSTGGSRFQISRLSSGSRSSLAGVALTARMPPLLNGPGMTILDGVPVNAPYFNENMPLRDGIPLPVRLEDGTTYTIQSPVINTVPGGMEIQQYFENAEWVIMSGDPLAYGPHLRKEPLAGVLAKSVLIQLSKGDQGVPNPTQTALVRAGDLANRVTFYRNDLAFAEDPTVPKDPHTFAARIDSLNPLVARIAFGAQHQMAVFFASDGKEIIHPEPARFFEVPIVLPLPEELNYIP